jgi:hypothetical protein
VTVLITVLVITLQQIPYALGYRMARPGMEFTGLLINVEDGSYLSAIGQGINGAWLYHIPFTTEEHAPAFIQVFYLTLGHLARWFGLSAAAMWHIARAALAGGLFLGLYGWMTSFIDAPGARRVAWIWALVGAGWDWTWFPFESPDPLGAAPLDWRMPEAHLFFSTLTYPHYAVNIGLVLLCLWCMWRVMSDSLPARRRWWLTGLAALTNVALGIVYPFFILVPAVVLAVSYAWIAWRARRIAWQPAVALAAAFIIPAPLFLYYVFQVAMNPVIQVWNAQAVTLSPNPGHYLLTYLPYVFLGILGITKTGNANSKSAFLWIWIIVVAILVYVPMNPQRRLVQGLHIPMTILATEGLCRIGIPWLARTRVFITLSQQPHYSIAGLQRLIVAGVIALTSLASCYVWVSSVALLALVQPYPLFRPTLELQAMDWLRANTQPEEIVLSSYWTGSYIPARTGNTVFVGQRYETNRFDEKRREAEQFFGAVTDDAWRVALLRDYRIAYVFWGAGERDLGEFDPEGASYLERVFANETARVYRVRAGER